MAVALSALWMALAYARQPGTGELAFLFRPAWNLAQGYVFGAAVSGGDLGGSIAASTARGSSPAWLTGGDFGPEASVVALALVTAVTISALLLVSWRAGAAGTGRSLSVVPRGL